MKNLFQRNLSHYRTLAHIFHTVSEKIAAMAPEISLQDSEDRVKLIRPRYLEGGKVGWQSV